MATNKGKTEQEIALEQARAEIAQMLAVAKAEAEKLAEDARAEAAKIIEDAKGAVNAAAAEAVAEKSAVDAEKAARLARGEEKVVVRLMRDGDKYKDDVFVAVNGEAIAIKRGVDVEIARKYAEVLDNSERQKNATLSLIDRETSKFEEETSKHIG